VKEISVKMMMMMMMMMVVVVMMVMMMMMMMMIIIIIINWSHWNSNEKLREKFGNYTRKTLDRFTTKDSYTWNITHNTESTAM